MKALLIGFVLLAACAGILLLPTGLTLREEPFHRPAATNDIAAMTQLLQRGQDVNATDGNGDTALVYALEHGHIEMADFLYAKGASLDLADRRGRTLRTKLEATGSAAALTWLKKHGR